MLVFIGVIIVVLGSTTYGDENPYAVCKIVGDPYLSPFPLNKCASLTSTSCALRNEPAVFFRNRYIKIEVVNSGSQYGNIVSFIVSLLDELDSDDDVCTFTEQYFKLSARNFTCGLARISTNGVDMQIQHREADFFVTIRYGYNNYNIDLQTSWQNANASKGMCRDGCVSPYATNVRSSIVRLVPQDQTTSSLAQQICDIYLKEYTKPNAPVPTNLIQFVEASRQGCITDVTTMGHKAYAEQALISIVSTIMTLNATSLEQIEKRTQQATVLANQLSKIADQTTAQLIADHKAENLTSN